MQRRKHQHGANRVSMAKIIKVEISTRWCKEVSLSDDALETPMEPIILLTSDTQCNICTQGIRTSLRVFTLHVRVLDRITCIHR